MVFAEVATQSYRGWLGDSYLFTQAPERIENVDPLTGSCKATLRVKGPKTWNLLFRSCRRAWQELMELHGLY